MLPEEAILIAVFSACFPNFSPIKDHTANLNSNTSFFVELDIPFIFFMKSDLFCWKELPGDSLSGCLGNLLTHVTASLCSPNLLFWVIFCLLIGQTVMRALTKHSNDVVAVN